MVCGFCQGTVLRDSGGTGRSLMEAMGSALRRHGGGASQEILPTDLCLFTPAETGPEQGSSSS